MLSNELLTLKALYSRSPRSAQEAASQITSGPRPHLYSDDSHNKYQRVLARRDVRAVIIALPIVSQPPSPRESMCWPRKPIAKDAATAQRPVSSYNQLAAPRPIFLPSPKSFRFVPRLAYAAEQAASLGRITHLSIKAMLLPHVAGEPILQDGEARNARALTSQVQPHLPPADTVSAILRMASDVLPVRGDIDELV